MKRVRELSDTQKQLLVQLKTEIPAHLSVDDIMALGARGLIDFSKGRGLKLTKRGDKAIEAIEHGKG